MPQALITINATPGSNDDLPIDMLVQLANADVGGEVSYLWSILDQPEGAADALSSTTIVNPTFTPQKEGTYLIQVIVNEGLPGEARNRVIAAVRDIKTRERIPAAGETEENGANGWAKVNGVNSLLRRVVEMRADPGLLVGVFNGTPTVGTVCRPQSLVTIKLGLPDEELVPVWQASAATDPVVRHVPQALLLRHVNGGPPVNNELAVFRAFGLITDYAVVGATLGDIAYVSDTARLDRVAGSSIRICGRIVGVPAVDVAHIYFNGLGGDN